MQVSHRSYLTAGVAALGAGAIALTPVQPISTHLALAQERTIADLSVTLASTIDPITPWVDTFETSIANIQSLSAFYLEKPFPLIQTWAANQVTYFQELTSGDANLIPGQIKNNIHTFFYAPWSPGDPAGEYISNAVLTTATAGLISIPVTQQFAFGLLPTILGQQTYDELEPIINFTATHYSGEVAGLLGTLLSPVVALTESFTKVGDYFKAGDVIGALNELINIPAYTTNAFLNGAGYVDLTAAVEKITTLPPELTSIGINLGGLISPPVPASGTVAKPTSFSGGTLFDTLAPVAVYPVPPLGIPKVKINDPGIPVGWEGSVIGLGQFLGEQLLVPKPAAAAQAVAPAAAAVPAAVQKPSAAAAVVAAPQNASAASSTGGSRAHHAGARG